MGGRHSKNKENNKKKRRERYEITVPDGHCPHNHEGANNKHPAVEYVDEDDGPSIHDTVVTRSLSVKKGKVAIFSSRH